jgi:hypothetical protein
MKQIKYKQLTKFLEALLEHGGIIRESKVRKLNNVQIRLICEICLNIVRCNIKLSKVFVNKLREYKLLLKKLTSKKVTLQSKKRILATHQGGNLLSILLPSLSNFLLKKS